MGGQAGGLPAGEGGHGQGLAYLQPGLDCVQGVDRALCCCAGESPCHCVALLQQQKVCQLQPAAWHRRHVDMSDLASMRG